MGRAIPPTSPVRSPLLRKALPLAPKSSLSAPDLPQLSHALAPVTLPLTPRATFLVLAPPPCPHQKAELAGQAVGT